MLVIRLFRTGKKNQPYFKIIVTDKKRPPRAGRFVQEVGFYNPLKKEKVLKQERIKYWLSVGAKPSDTVYNLLISEKIIEGKKIPIYIKKTKPAETSSHLTSSPPSAHLAKEEKPAAEAPAENKAEKVDEEKPNEEKSAQEAPKTE